MENKAACECTFEWSYYDSKVFTRVLWQFKI